jgi:hypothetical protein
MNNLWINLRLWYWHLQVSRDRPWLWVSFNRYRWARGLRSPWLERH